MDPTSITETYLPDLSISRVQEVCAQKEEENRLDEICVVDLSGILQNKFPGHMSGFWPLQVWAMLKYSGKLKMVEGRIKMPGLESINSLFSEEPRRGALYIPRRRFRLFCLTAVCLAATTHVLITMPNLASFLISSTSWHETKTHKSARV